MGLCCSVAYKEHPDFGDIQSHKWSSDYLNCKGLCQKHSKGQVALERKIIEIK
jgi:hypothetical protein